MVTWQNQDHQLAAPGLGHRTSMHSRPAPARYVPRSRTGTPDVSRPVKTVNCYLISGLRQCILPAMRPRMIAQHPAAVRGPETGRELRATKYSPAGSSASPTGPALMPMPAASRTRCLLLNRRKVVVNRGNDASPSRLNKARPRHWRRSRRMAGPSLGIFAGQEVRVLAGGRRRSPPGRGPCGG